MHIILASSSIGRKHLLAKLGIPFTILPSDVDEESILHPDPFYTIALRSQAKAEKIKECMIKTPDSISDHILIIGADTMAVLDHTHYGKPKDKNDAKHMLHALMGKAHTLATHVTAIYMKGGKEAKRWDTTERSLVTLRTISERDLDLYVHTYDLTRFAGCYGLDETPWDLITKIQGSYTNVIGLPFEVILPIYKELQLI